MKQDTWTRSARCEAHNCVEVAWQTSNRCVAEAHCIEVGLNSSAVLVRDTKLGDSSPILSFTPESWRLFVKSL